MKKSTVAYHARRLGVPADERFAKRYDWGEIQIAYDSGLTVRQCMRKFGFTSASWHKAVQRQDVKARPRSRGIEEFLVKGTTRNGRAHLKRRLLSSGLKEDRCEECGISHWRGRKLSIQIHHKNGDGTDNRLQNLVFLCPNCHSQTDTFSGRNRHRRRKLPRRPE